MENERYKKLTLLHSNDLHGDFLAEQVDEKLVGGVSLLSGYVSKVRAEEKNSLYAIAGDMFRGSVIDSEYKGMSTIEIMNALAPDIVTIGNHEVDYGLANLLFMEKCARFPIINANLHSTVSGTRLFQPYRIFEIDGMNILFIGITTEEIIATCLKEELGSFVSIEEAAMEVGRICNAYRAEDIDLTVLLTHIGFDEDKKLAALLPAELGVDLIIGGHSHTVIEKPEIVNGIQIVQAGVGTDLLGRFDLVIDTDNNCIASSGWRYVEINDRNCPRDLAVEECIEKYKSATDLKYQRVVTRFLRKLTHPGRYQETELGALISNILTKSLGISAMLFASGALRKTELGPLVLYRDFKEIIPFDESITMFRVTGAQFKEMIRFMLRDEVFAEGAHAEFYQLPDAFRITYRRSTREFEQFDYKGKPLEDTKMLRIGMNQYHWLNVSAFLNIPMEEILKNGRPKIIAVATNDIVEEYLGSHTRIDSKVIGRIRVVE